jgi:hypothetical protein
MVWSWWQVSLGKTIVFVGGITGRVDHHKQSAEYFVLLYSQAIICQLRPLTASCAITPSTAFNKACATACVTPALLHLTTPLAGGNGIASALPALEELAEAGVITQGMPALLLWVCRKGHEFTFMAAPVVAAARALGLNLNLQLYITGGWVGGWVGKGAAHIRATLAACLQSGYWYIMHHCAVILVQQPCDVARVYKHVHSSTAYTPSHCHSGHSHVSACLAFHADLCLAVCAAAGAVLLCSLSDRADVKQMAASATPSYSTADADPSKDHTTIRPTLDISATATSSSDLPSFSGSDSGLGGAPGGAAPTSLCPVVAFASWSAQLSFKAILHLAVFGGEWRGAQLGCGDKGCLVKLQAVLSSLYEALML